MGRFDSLELENIETQQEEKKLKGAQVQNADYHIKDGLDKFLANDIEASMRAYSKALEIDPGSTEAWIGQLSCLIELEELHESDIWIKKAIEIVGESQELLAIKARIKCRQGDFDRAYGLSDASLKFNGNSYLTWTVRGEILLYAKKKQSEHCFEKAINTFTNNYLVYADIIRSCLFAENYYLALNYAKQATELFINNPHAHLLAAKCYDNLGKTKLATKEIDIIMELNPDYCGVRKLVMNDSAICKLFKILRRKIW